MYLFQRKPISVIIVCYWVEDFFADTIFVFIFSDVKTVSSFINIDPRGKNIKALRHTSLNAPLIYI